MTPQPKIRTGRRTTFVVGIMTVLIMTVLGVSNFLSVLSGQMTFTLIEGLAIVAGALSLILEVFFEGDRTGLFDRSDFTAMDIVAGVIGFGLLATGVTGTIGALLGTPIIAMPSSLQGVAILIGAVLLAQELFTE